MGKPAARRKSVLILLTRREKEKERRRAISSFGLFFFVCLVVTGFAGRGFSQDLTTLAERLRSGNIEERRTALMQIRSLRSEEAARIAIPALKDRSPMVRAMAAASVVFLPQSEASALLLPLLRDKDEFVRREGASALGDVGDPSAASQLTRSFTSDKSPEVRTAAAVALGKVGNLSAIDPLVALFGQKPTKDNEMLRRAAARSIGQIAQITRTGNLRVLTPKNFLPEKFKDIGAKPSPDLLSHFAGAVPTLIRVLESSNEADDTRREAAFALGAIGDRSAEPILSKYTSSSDVYLAEISKEALLKLKAVE